MAYQADSGFALVSLAGAGLRVAVVPSSITSINFGDNIVYRPISGILKRIGIDLVFRRDEEDPAVTNFLNVVRLDER
jgi:DNA-binding transcriptional LysR family regulator